MNNNGPQGGGFRFGAYEIRLLPRELYREGSRIRLQEKPFQVLELLVEKAGTTVTREEFRQRLWSADTHVEFDANLNAALTKVRQALDESAGSPRFIETVSRMGYRFTAAVQPLEAGDGAAGGEGHPAALGKKGAPVPAASVKPAEAQPRRWRRGSLLIVPTLIAITLLYPYAIRSFGPRLGTAGKAVLLVLPFASLSGDSQDENLGDGFTDELIAQIEASSSGKLSILPRVSAAPSKGGREMVKKIGKELGADFVLDGSVRRENGQAQVSANLFRAQTQSRLWAHAYEVSAGDIGQMKRDLARSVAEALAIELLFRPSPSLSLGAKQNPEAYEAYLEGRLSWSERSRNGLQRAERLFSRSVLSDPQFALGYAGLADTYLVQTNWEIESPDVGYRHARLAAQKALALNQSLGSAHAVLASVSWEHERSWQQAEAEYRLAISFDPANATIHQWYAEALGTQGRTAEALAELRLAHELDPLSRIIVGAESNLLYMARRYDQAIETAKKLVEMDPGFPPGYCYLSHGYVALGKHAEALNAHLKYLELNGAPESYRAALLRTMESGGIRAVWKRYLEDLRQRETREYVSPIEKAVIEIRLGDYPAALTDLERSYAIGDGNLEWINVDPALDPLRQEPRFRNLLVRMHLES